MNRVSTVQRWLLIALGLCIFVTSVAMAAVYTIPARGAADPATTYVQTLTAGQVITANRCAGVKLVDAAGAVSTDATNAFTASTTGGCYMHVCNVSSGANTITIKRSANVLTATGADLALAQNSCVTFGSDGSKWRQLSGMVTDS